MPHDLVLYYSPGACSLAVHLALEESGLAFEARRVAISEGAHRSPDFLAVNPRGRVPAMLIDGRLVTEVQALLQLAAELSPAPLMPDAPAKRARMRELLAFHSGTVHVGFAQVWRPERFTDDPAAQPAIVAGGRERLAGWFDEIEAAAGSGGRLDGGRPLFAGRFPALRLSPLGVADRGGDGALPGLGAAHAQAARTGRGPPRPRPRGTGRGRVAGEPCMNDEARLMSNADARAAAYLAGVGQRRVYPDEAALTGLSAFDEALFQTGRSSAETLALLDERGSPATTASNGPNYYGFVIGAALPVAAAAERLLIAWDQCASSYVNSPAAAAIEKVAGRWVLDVLDLPREGAVGFGTSAAACGLACLVAARRSLLARQGWDLDRDGLHGAPEVRVVVSETVHMTVLKALRLLGFGMGRIARAPVDALGRVDPEQQLPPLDDRTILCLQAGEVNTGEFDPFAAIVPRAKAAGCWIHIDGTFGMWARAARAEKCDLNWPVLPSSVQTVEDIFAAGRRHSLRRAGHARR